MHVVALFEVAPLPADRERGAVEHDARQQQRIAVARLGEAHLCLPKRRAALVEASAVDDTVAGAAPDDEEGAIAEGQARVDAAPLGHRHPGPIDRCAIGGGAQRSQRATLARLLARVEHHQLFPVEGDVVDEV
ncbi:MAG: hypothetical protein KC503_07345 [Myxococcales bacterium]|nr:hypothetical protein [Myxococcales bacterium]